MDNLHNITQKTTESKEMTNSDAQIEVAVLKQYKRRQKVLFNIASILLSNIIPQIIWI